MKISKKANLILTAILFSAVVFTSCDKDEKDDKADNTPAASTVKSGNIKASVSYSPVTNGNFVHYLKGNMKIELLKDGANKATQFSNGNSANIDFGQYEYGIYTVKVTGDVWSMNANTGSNSAYTTINETQTVNLDALTKTATFSISK